MMPVKLAETVNVEEGTNQWTMPHLARGNDAFTPALMDTRGKKCFMCRLISSYEN